MDKFDSLRTTTVEEVVKIQQAYITAVSTNPEIPTKDVEILGSILKGFISLLRKATPVEVK